VSGRFGIDFAWGRPSTHELRAAGVTFVGRYFSHDPSKDLTASELHGYQHNGIGVVVAWETTATRTQDGELAGAEDARAALARAHAIGYGGAVDFAVDFDAEGPEVFHYFRGARHVAGSRCGVYGGYRVVKYLFDNNLVSHGWQTYAWSSGRWDRRAVLRQYSNDHTLAGVSCDYDVELGGAPAKPRVSPSLAVLEPEERKLANTLLAYRQHPHLHAHGITVTHAALVVKRKEVWAAAKHEVDHGKTWAQAWAFRHRGTRYKTLWGLTR
jgi:Domain of unknown function (DUF1906)